MAYRIVALVLAWSVWRVPASETLAPIRGTTMARTVVIDELHVTFRIPNDLPEGETEAIRQALDGDDILDRLRRAIRAAIRALPELAAVRTSLTR